MSQLSSGRIHRLFCRFPVILFIEHAPQLLRVFRVYLLIVEKQFLDGFAAFLRRRFNESVYVSLLLPLLPLPGRCVFHAVPAALSSPRWIMLASHPVLCYHERRKEVFF